MNKYEVTAKFVIEEDSAESARVVANIKLYEDDFQEAEVVSVVELPNPTKKGSETERQ